VLKLSNISHSSICLEALEIYGRMPQVARLFLGTAHDGGYHSPLAALQLDNLLSKIVLLRGYSGAIPKDLRRLQLKEARFEGLFLDRPINPNLTPGALPIPTVTEQPALNIHQFAAPKFAAPTFSTPTSPPSGVLVEAPASSESGGTFFSNALG
jgi:hypothetical protein